MKAATVIFAVLGCLLDSFIGWSEAASPPVISQIVAVSRPVIDEFGDNLKGSDPGAIHFGGDHQPGALVHVYTAPQGIIYPPGTDSQADTRHTLLFTTRIGVGTSARNTRPGTFCAAITPRPDSGTKIFVRVFNAPSAEEASFYQDSQVFTVSWASDQKFIAEFPGAMLPLDDADDDGDGLSNSMEKSLGTDPHQADTDKDTFTDAEEVMAGTDPADPESGVIIDHISITEHGLIRLGWWSVRGRVYDVQQASDGLTDADCRYETISTHHGVDDFIWLMLNGQGGEEGVRPLRIRVRPFLPE